MRRTANSAVAHGDRSKLPDRLDAAADSIESGAPVTHDMALAIAEWLRQRAAHLRAFPFRPRGRPKGARTKVETAGVKQARQFFDLILEDGIPDTLAAKKVADQWNVPPSSVKRNARRHEPRLVEDIERETEQLKQSLERMKSGSAARVPDPLIVDRLLETFRAALLN